MGFTRLLYFVCLFLKIKHINSITGHVFCTRCFPLYNLEPGIHRKMRFVITCATSANASLGSLVENTYKINYTETVIVLFVNFEVSVRETVKARHWLFGYSWGGSWLASGGFLILSRPNLFCYPDFWGVSYS